MSGNATGRLQRIIRAVSDHTPVDWEAERSAGAHLAASIDALRVLHEVAGVYRRLGGTAPDGSRPNADGRRATPNQPIPLPEARGKPEAKAAARWGPLHLIEKIGEGSFGEVFRAYDPQLQVEVALKLRRRGPGQARLERQMIQEARRLARLRHDNVLVVHGVARHAGRVGMWTDLLQGQTLEQILASRGPFGPTEAALIGMDLCRALSALHTVHLVHRDLKTSNVMREAGGRIVLVDFGTAIEDATSTGANRSPRAGTPLAMAPELLRGRPPTAVSDIYGLGVILYRLVSGRYPLEANSLDELIAMHDQGRIVHLRDRRADLPREFVEVVERALAANPRQRFASAGAMEQALARCIVGARATRRAQATAHAWQHSAVRHNLPLPNSSFVGRARPMRDCSSLLNRGRSVTLTGVGGVGKTRLALELAAARLDRHPDGVWFVDLSALTNGEGVPHAVSTALGVGRQARKSILQSIAVHLGAHRMLIVLDNCEHVLAACRTLVEFLLASCPELVVLATSREPLGLDGERIYPVPPMSVPVQEEASRLESARSSEAVLLFADRARLIQPGFELNSRNVGAVSEICRRLDGIPFAIELAAIQLRLLSPVEIRDMLKDRFRLLRARGRALPRRLTLQATLEWSYDLLNADERALFCSLAVFSGGWTLDAASAVCRDDGDSFALLELLTHLVDKSLVNVDRRDDATSRYRFLDTVREFAAARLDRTRRRPALEERHVDHFLALAESAESELLAKGASQWTARLEADHENLLAALDACAASPPLAVRGARLAGALARFWSVRGFFELGRRMLARVLDGSAAVDDLRARAKALSGAGELAAIQDDAAAARRLFEEALEVAESLEDGERIARALSGLSHVALNEGDLAGARLFCQRSLAIRRSLGEPGRIALALNNLGAVLWRQGDLTSAGPTVAEAVASARQAGDQYVLRLALINQQLLALLTDGTRGSAGGLAECLQLIRDRGDKRDAPAGLEIAASLASLQERPDIAARLYGAADAIRRALGIPSDEAWQTVHAPHLARVRERLGTTRFAGGWAAGGALSIESALQEALTAFEPSEQGSSQPQR